MLHAILPAKLLLRNMYHIIAQRKSWDALVTLDPATIQNVKRWVQAISSWNGAPIQVAQTEIQLQMDASETGWGGFVHGSGLPDCFPGDTAGTWNKRVSHEQSNFRELLAVRKCLHTFSNLLAGQVVQVISDNITMVTCINRIGTPSELLNTLTRTMFVDCQELGMILTAKWTTGKDNGHADHLSRTLSTYEWQLHPRVFHQIDCLWGPHTVDRFASETTAHLEVYNSLFNDPGTSGVDALAQPNWHQENNFINMPFFLLPRILAKVRETKCWATVVAPHWPGQSWYQEMLTMSVGLPLWLPNHPRLFLKQAGQPEPRKKTQNGSWLFGEFVGRSAEGRGLDGPGCVHCPVIIRTIYLEHVQQDVCVMGPLPAAAGCGSGKGNVS